MSEIIAVPTCGTCAYAQAFKDHTADCFGNPPSIHVVGATRDVLNRPALQLEAFVPKVRDDRPACALYKRKTEFVTIGHG